ncbi:MAG: DUF4340 domain-containing protein [Acidobacteriota bacterium]
MKPRALLILFLLVAGLGAFIYFVERDLPGSEERAQRGKRVLPEFERAELAALVLDGGDRRARLERRERPPSGAGDESEDATDEAEPAADWVLTEPEALTAADGTPPRVDSFAVSRFLDSLADLSWSRRLDDADRAAVGLDEPRARVTLVFEDGTRRSLEFGAEIPASTTTLASLAGSGEVLVVEGAIVADITRDPGSWRDRQLLRLARSDIDRLALRPSAGGEIVLARHDENSWRLAAPVADRADEDRVDELLADLTLLSVESFVDDGSRDAAFAAAAGDLEVDAGEDGMRLLVIGSDGVDGDAEDGGGEDGEVRHAVRFGGQTGILRSKLPAVLLRTVDAWRSPMLSRLRPHQVDRLVVTERVGAIELERDGSDWRRGDDAISYEPVSDLLAALTEARSAGFSAPDGVGGEPELTVLLAGDAGEETLSFGPPAGDAVTASVAGRDVALRLQPSVLEEVRSAIAGVRAAKPLPPASDDAGDGEPAVDP